MLRYYVIASLPGVFKWYRRFLAIMSGIAAGSLTASFILPPIWTWWFAPTNFGDLTQGQLTFGILVGGIILVGLAEHA